MFDFLYGVALVGLGVFCGAGLLMLTVYATVNLIGEKYSC